MILILKKIKTKSRKSVEQELDEKANITEADKDAEKVSSTDEQVANRMQRLNLYFEKENVRP